MWRIDSSATGAKLPVFRLVAVGAIAVYPRLGVLAARQVNRTAPRVVAGRIATSDPLAFGIKHKPASHMIVPCMRTPAVDTPDVSGGILDAEAFVDHGRFPLTLDLIVRRHLSVFSCNFSCDNVNPTPLYCRCPAFGWAWALLAFLLDPKAESGLFLRHWPRFLGQGLGCSMAANF